MEAKLIIITQCFKFKSYLKRNTPHVH